MNSLLRFLAAGAFALWWGGFTFYALVVIPIAQKVLRSHTRVGFITQEVTQWINWCGAITLLFLLWQLLTNPASAPRVRRWLWISWFIMLVTQTSLFLLHPRLNALLDFSAREILDEPRFYFLHRIYLCVATMQWLGGMLWLAVLFLVPSSLSLLRGLRQ